MLWSEATVIAVDTETTGTDPATARIVECAAVEFGNGRVRRSWQDRVNPGCAIPTAASAVHGIFDDDVANAPRFGEVASEVRALLVGSSRDPPPVLTGYNLLAYDLPLLDAELARAGLPPVPRDRVVDPIVFARWHRPNIGHKLGVTCRIYAVPLTHGHLAGADATASGELLYAMVDAGHIPLTIEDALEEQTRLAALLAAEWARYGYWLYADRETPVVLRLGFGKNHGYRLDEVSPSYLRYMLDAAVDLPEEVRKLFTTRAGDG